MSNKDVRITEFTIFGKTPQQIEERINYLYNLSESDISIFDVLEMLSILKLQIDLTKAKGEFYKQIKKYQNSLDEKKIIESFDVIWNNENSENNQSRFGETFLEFFVSYDLGSKLSEENFQNYVENNIPLHILLKDKYWSEKYPEVLKSILISNPTNIELLLSNFSDSNVEYFFPKNISKQEYYDLAQKYVTVPEQYNGNTVTPNLNYLRLMENGIKGIQSFLIIDSRLKLQIKQEIKRQTDEIFSKDSGFSTGIIVTSDWEQYTSPNPQNELRGFIDAEFIGNNNAKESLLNSIKYLDNLFTPDGQLNLSSFPNIESSALMRAFGIKSKNHYPESFFFQNKQSLILMELNAFQKLVKKHHELDIEDLIGYFFTDYSIQNLEVDWLPLGFSTDSKVKNRTKILFTIEENIRKQWKLLLEDSEINQELYNLESTPSISSLKSFLPKKYLYPFSKEISRIFHLLFSDQSDITYINENLRGSSFIELVSKNDVKKSDFLNFQENSLSELLKYEILSEKEGILFFDNNQMIDLYIFKMIWSYGAANYYNLPKLELGFINGPMQEAADKLIEKNILKCETTLFSKPESDYLNYLLNNSLFDNALALRNKYEHDFVAENDNEYFMNYLYALLVLLLYVIKINEEFHFKVLLEGKEGLWAGEKDE